MEHTYTVALAGNPNVGKSTVFNRLTGLRQHTGNWPGKTVERAEGYFSQVGQRFRLVDLPGTYSLAADSPEEEVAGAFLQSGQADAVIVVVDASCLRRGLILALQLRQQTQRLVLCVNLMDEAARRGITPQIRRLGQLLDVPVVATAARSGKGLAELRHQAAEVCRREPWEDGWKLTYAPPVEAALGLLETGMSRRRAVALLWGLLGWKFTAVYVAVGMTAGVIGGFFMDSIRAERWLQPFIMEAMNSAPAPQYVSESGQARKLTIRQRHIFAYGETVSIFRRVWKWVIIGVGAGAALHGLVPENWFAEHLGTGEWWSVPAAVLVGIPLYSNVTGIVPVMESLLVKGLPVGTTMAFCMSAVAASIPEVMMLRRIMTFRLQAAFIGYLWVIFTLTGWLFNFLGPHIL